MEASVNMTVSKDMILIIHHFLTSRFCYNFAHYIRLLTMRNILLFFIILSCLISCNNHNKDLKEDPYDKKIIKQALRVAENYSMQQLKDEKKSVDKEGIIRLAGKGIAYFIDPSRIVTGEIDEDSIKDAIVPIYIVREHAALIIEHLVLINKKGKFINVKEMENVLKIIEIKDRIIFAEISTVAPDSPTFGCEICREVIKYQFRGNTFSIIK